MPNDVVNNAAADGSSGLGEGQGRDQGVEEGAAEEFTTRVRPSPPTPTAQDVDQHKSTGHAIFRSWCSECVGSSFLLSWRCFL